MIVVRWNSAQVLGRCLEHLFAQDYASYEVIVVDDGSTDETVAVAERAASTHPQLSVMRSDRNRGCPHARNLGLGRAKGELVAFVDADGYAAPDWLSRIAEAFEADPTIGGVASTSATFPAGVPPILRPRPQDAGSAIDVAAGSGEHQLLYGWYPAEHVAQRSYHWAAAQAAGLNQIDMSRICRASTARRRRQRDRHSISVDPTRTATKRLAA